MNKYLFLYIDPSTGSMLFAVIIGVVSAVFFGVKGFIMKAKQNFGVDKKKINNEHKLDYVIFSDHKRYWNVFKPICDEFEKRGVEVHYWTMSPDDPALSESYTYVKPEFIGEGNKGFAKLNFMNAHICLSTTPGLDVYQWKRSKDVSKYVHVCHAAGLARGGYKMFGFDYYDVILQVSEHHLDYIRELEMKRNLPAKEIVTVGQPYLDEMKKRYESIKKVANDKKVILVAPSWGPNSILEKYGEKFIKAVVDTGYQVVIRPHPQTNVEKPELINNLKEKFNNVEWNFDNDNFDILNRSDVMISDFSGIIFDYSLIFDKPVMYTYFKRDLSSYDDATLDDKEWTERTLKKFAVELKEDDFATIKSQIDDLLSNDKYKVARQELKNEIWGNIGNAAETIVSYLINQNKGLK